MLRWLLGGVVAVALGFVVPACTGGSCNREVAAMRATLAAVPADAYCVHGVEVGADTPLPTVVETAATLLVRETAPVVHVHKDGTLELLGSQPETIDPDGLIALMEELRSHRDRELALYLVFAPDVAITSHLRWLARVDRASWRMPTYQGDTPLRVLVRVPTPTRTGTRAAAEDAGRLAALADEVRTLSANCEPLAQGFASLPSTAPQRKRDLLTNLVVERAEACGCAKVDMAALTALIVFMLSGDDPGLRWLPLDFDSKSGVGLRTDATAQDLAEVMAANPGRGIGGW